MKRAIIIMAKIPTPGTVKTRLQSILSPEKCAELAEAFLLDTLKKSETICKNIILAYSPVSERRFQEEMFSPGIILIEQKGNNLGERITNAFDFAFRENSTVVMIGTDSPTFPARYIAQAFAALETQAEIVLGKSADGGFYMIGLRRKPLPEIFDGVEWSSSLVFEQILKNIKSAGIEKLKLIPEHYDVDTPEDFLMLKKEISGSENLQKLAEKTYRWLVSNREITGKKSA